MPTTYATQMQVPMRTAATQTFIDAVAADLFSHSERSLLQAETGKPYEATKFSLMEFAQLQQMYPYNTPKLYRTHIHFYLFALTLDNTVARLTAVLRIIEKLDDIGSMDTYEGLKKALWHPDRVMWGVVEHNDYEKLRPVDRAAYDLVDWDVYAPRYLCRFPLIKAIMALSHGLYIYNNGSNNTEEVWCNATRDARPCAAAECKDVDAYIRNQEHLPTAVDIKHWIDDNTRVLPTGGPMDTLNLDAGYNDLDLATKSKTGTVCKRIAESVHRVGGLQVLYGAFNDVVHEFNRVMLQTHLNLTTDSRSFIGNLSKGPLYGSTILCAAGFVPRLRDRDGNDLDYNAVVANVNGHQRVSGKVDLTKSTCMREVHYQ